MQVSLFANLKNIVNSSSHYVHIVIFTRNMYMVTDHIVYFHYCNDVGKISMWIFVLSLKKYIAIYICYSTIL